MNENTELRKEAKERAEMTLGFYIHLVIYIIINPILISIWYFTGMVSLWIFVPLVGWLIGLLAHYLLTFVFTGRNFLDGMVEREYEKLTRD